MKPTPTFKFFCSDNAAAFSHRRTAGPIGGKRLFGKDVDTSLHRIFKLQGAESGVRCQHNDILCAETVDGAAIGVEPEELSLGRNIDLTAKLGLQVSRQPILQSILEQIRHRDQLDRSPVSLPG